MLNIKQIWGKNRRQRCLFWQFLEIHYCLRLYSADLFFCKFLCFNSLQREILRIEHVKPHLLGHWGTTPELNFIYVHLNRLIIGDFLRQKMRDKLLKHKAYINEYGDDLPEIRDWKWSI